MIVNDFVAEKTLSDKLFSPQSLEKWRKVPIGYLHAAVALCYCSMLIDDSEMSFVSQNSARVDVWSSDRDLGSLKTLGKQVSGPMVRSSLTLSLRSITT